MNVSPSDPTLTRVRHVRTLRKSRARRGVLHLALVPLTLLALVLPFAPLGGAGPPIVIPPGTIDPTSIPKWVNQLDSPPPVWVPDSETYDDEDNLVSQNYTIAMRSFEQQLLPTGYATTPVWGYAGNAKDALTGANLGYIMNSPGASFEATRYVTNYVKWVNNIEGDHQFPVDPTLHWANPNDMEMPEEPFEPYPEGYAEAQSNVPLVTHLHGGEVQSTSDGGPEGWWTADGDHGDGYSTLDPETTEDNAAVFEYPNEQLPTTLWYHDHALGVTRTNVMSGLAGFYMLRDPVDPIASLLPSGKYDMPLVFQDRTFNTDGSLWFDTVGLNVDVHPYWMPEFFGNTIMVNGKVWPNMDVDKGQYMFRLLDGSNARFYTITFSNGMPFKVIGTDGGYLRAPATVTKLTIAPGERYVVLVDFSSLAPGTKVVMLNNARTPFPTGTPVFGGTVGQLVQFTVTGSPGFVPKVLPPILNPTLAAGFPSIMGPVDKTRTLVLTEVMGPEGPLEILLNGQKWHADPSEIPTLGTVEKWIIVNPTADTHPIHLHLTQFQLLSRQKMDTETYNNDWMMLNADLSMMEDGMPPFMGTPEELSPTAYLTGNAKSAPSWERGWKDTIQMNPGEVTIILVRFAPNDGSPEYSFDASVGPGYVWHCHILDHEDNEMMRPMYVVKPET